MASELETISCRRPGWRTVRFPSQIKSDASKEDRSGNLHRPLAIHSMLTDYGVGLGAGVGRGLGVTRGVGVGVTAGSLNA